MEYVILNNGVQMPRLGFGTYSRQFDFTTEAISNAIDVGYRHIDTAALYKDEDLIGDAIKASGLPREEFFITTKVFRTSMGYQGTIRSFEESAKKLQTDYVDLLLIHWPVPEFGPVATEANPARTPETEGIPWPELCQDTWRAMEQLVKEGKARSIGVSNFHPHHLMALMETARIKPVVNQIEFHPGYTQEYTVNWCQERDIRIEAWRPMAKQLAANDPLLLELAQKYGKSVQQICIRFALQRNVVPLPGSRNRERMTANMQVFDFNISEEDMSRIACMPHCAWSGQHPDRLRGKEG